MKKKESLNWYSLLLPSKFTHPLYPVGVVFGPARKVLATPLGHRTHKFSAANIFCAAGKYLAEEELTFVVEIFAFFVSLGSSMVDTCGYAHEK